ncbi:FR47-like protein domain-containing protein [Apiospora arundinis]|uniref:FR47-like protein domain-containing protein n=1 Tax=Apiospora arundinis TaxID=335852 RepID=A0ABR2HPQ6_9PEZI
MQNIHVYAVQPNGDFALESPAPNAGEGTGTGNPYTSVDVITFLTQRLPRSLPVLRLLQLGPRNPGTLVITTPLPLQGPVEGAKGEDGPASVCPEQVWTMLVVDRSSHPATEIWPFSSLEMYHGTAPHEKGPQKAAVLPAALKDSLPFSEEVLRAATAQLLSVASHIPVTWRDTTSMQSPAERLANVRHTPGSPYCLFGNTHSTVTALLARADSDSESSGSGSPLILNPSVPYGKYVFPVPSPFNKQQEGSSATLLPEGLVWSTIGPDDYADVMAVNKIIRSPTTLAKLRSAAIREAAPRPDGRPGKAVAFAFAAGDGSVRTLHVDPAYRRRGLAKMVVARLLGMGLFEPPRSGPLATKEEDLLARKEGDHGDITLAFAGIEESNTGSIRTFQALGGKWLWDVYWIYLDLDRARELAQG